MTDDKQEPAAWMVSAIGIGSIMPLCHTRKEAESVAAKLTSPSVVVPLYRQPQPTLTAPEIKSLKTAIDAYELNNDDDECEQIAVSLRGLLKRLGGFDG